MIGPSGKEVAIVSGTFTQNGFSFPAQDGVQWLDLTGVSSNSTEGVQQTVATTAATNYQLSFWVGNVVDPTLSFGISSTVEVDINGVLLGEYKGGFTPFSFDLTTHLRQNGDNVLVVQLDSTERADVPPFGTTQPFLAELLAHHKQHGISTHLEVETYTWDVLPPHLRDRPIDEAIAAELSWVLERLR